MEACRNDFKALNSYEEVICIKNVTFYYKSHENPSISNINLSINRGEFIVFMGESGCGKTTITRIINGLALKFYEGEMNGNVSVLNKSINDYASWEIGKFVGSIFQDPKSQFFASITEDEVAFGCENYGFRYNELKDRVFNSIKIINGMDLMGKEIYPMSSGEKQKIAIASINSINPMIYVFDEPSANLDMNSVELLKKLMQALKEAGHTVVVAEHRLYYLADLADKFIYLKDGQVEREMTPKALIGINEDKRRKLGIRSSDLKKITFNGPKLSGNKLETLSVKDLSFYYKRGGYVFNNISFKTYVGDIIAICGRNGAGKTTLSKILCGIKKEKHGDILYSGKKISYKKRKNNAYFVMQNTDCSLFGDSVENELRLNKKYADDKYIDKILGDYNLLSCKKNHPSSLSGGQKQRLSLAVSDVIDSDILILDEPTSGLDYKNMCNISNHIRELSTKGKTILIITHDYEFAAMTCNKVLHFISSDKIEMFDLVNNHEKLFHCFMSK